MKIPRLFSFFIFFSFSFSFACASVILDFAPTPQPSSSAPTYGFGSDSTDYSPPAPSRSSKRPLSPLPAPASAPAERSEEAVDGQSPAAANGSADEDSGKNSSLPPPGEFGETVRWCTVRGEMEDCRFLLNLLSKSSNFTWTCVIGDNTFECLDTIRRGDADIINLEAGAAFTAFLNYSMKVIANEIYCNHAESYDAVAIVPRKSCEAKRSLNLLDFKGHRSCHGGYSSASGWTYPIDHIKNFAGSDKMDDVEVATNFFSKVCAPSDSGLGGRGICSGCGDENDDGTNCYQDSLYYGDAGAFRCLVEGLGDVAFVRGDTALLYSMEGPYNQSWSKRSVRDFMYLCPQGGCREINGYPGACSFGMVPANTIMASNSIQNHKRLHILERLANSSWIEAAHTERVSSIHMISPSTQEFTWTKSLTRSYLGQSASFSQSIHHLKTQKAEGSASSANSFPDQYSMLKVLLPAVLVHFFYNI